MEERYFLVVFMGTSHTPPKYAIAERRPFISEPLIVAPDVGMDQEFAQTIVDRLNSTLFPTVD